MCYTIKIDHTREQLENRFGARFSEPDRYTPGNKINAFSLPLLPVICSNNPEEIRLFHWGLIPYWVKDVKTAGEIRMKTFNARSESILSKASFKHCVHSNRCIIPVNGFYEWQTMGKQKIPYFMGIEGTSLFALAGLYDQWTNRETGEFLNTFTILTTKANPALEVIHNTQKRMPVMLTIEDKDKWLNTKTDPLKENLFEPFPEEKMVFTKTESTPSPTLF